MTFLLVLSVLIYRGDILLRHAFKRSGVGKLPNRALWHQKYDSLRSLTATLNVSGAPLLFSCTVVTVGHGASQAGGRGFESLLPVHFSIT
jgi:hypothetical protein